MKSTIMDQSYQSCGGMDRPLFGESNKREQYANYAVGLVTIIAVLAVIGSSFLHNLNPTHIILSFVIVLICASNVILIWWYREGDLDPKFRNLIYYNSAVILLLCVIAFVIIFET